ncbi:MAG: hypothetical protein U0946_00215 [Patescibacteria group bacterium]|nr:hypothetical protein [Patescibacteria group bacterium]
MSRNDDESSDNGNKTNRRWRMWHEREIPVKIFGEATKNGAKVTISSNELKTELKLDYPNGLWQHYPKENKVKLVDNITYILTVHLRFLLKGNIRLEYSTGYPQVHSWANHVFMRYLPAYWYLYKSRRGTGVFPVLKVLLNSNVEFSETKDVPPRFPTSIDENVIIPFTFGKDSFLTYFVAKEIGLKPVLVFFEDPTDGGYEGKHKQELFDKFTKTIKDKTYFISNPIGNLREKGEGWFGWELALNSWALLALPIAYRYKSGYIIFSNEKSCNDFFYDDDGLKVLPDYEQSAQATEEMSLVTQALSEGEVYTTTFLQGLNELGIIGILKDRYNGQTFKYLMSCWSETDFGKHKRWCGECSKCARIYVYLMANGINPIKEAGFEDDMLQSSKAHLYNVFGQRASGTGWDAFALNIDEQNLAFYLAFKRGFRVEIIDKFITLSVFKEVEQRLEELVEEYFGLHNEHLTPPQWKKKIDRIFNESLNRIKKELLNF